MNTIRQSASYTQKHLFSINLDEYKDIAINGYPLYQYEKPILKLAFPNSHSEYLLQKYRSLLAEVISSSKSMYSKTVSSYFSEGESLIDTDYRLLSDKPKFTYKKPILELQSKICNVYEKHQTRNWDGYEAEPIQYLEQSLRFARALFAESRLLIESVDIVPENDGCLCFEWFKTDSKFINISVKNNILIFNYKIGDEKGCGETTFSGKQMLIEQIKKIA